MNPEQYQPNPEEVQQGDNMLGRAEKTMTDKREARENYKKEIGVEGNLNIVQRPLTQEEKEVWRPLKSFDGDLKIVIMEGNINGRNVEVSRLMEPIGRSLPVNLEKAVGDDEPDERFWGSVTKDGETTTLTSGQAKQFFKKYFAASEIVSKEKELSDKAAFNRKIYADQAPVDEKKKDVLGDLL
jgi:hypothetical protein